MERDTVNTVRFGQLAKAKSPMLNASSPKMVTEESRDISLHAPAEISVTEAGISIEERMVLPAKRFV